MKILLFGATGMVGQGVLRESLQDRDVDAVVTVGRTASGGQGPKLRDLVIQDFHHFDAVESQWRGVDACFFCLGVSSAGMAERDYEKVTYGITLAAAGALSRMSPNCTFIYVSGAGTDSTERGRTMWARVKGKTENALLRLPFKAAYMFRPGVIEPLHGIQPKTPWYRVLYTLMKPVLPWLRSLFPDHILTTEQIGRAMLVAAKQGAPRGILEAKDIRALAEEHPATF